MARASNRKSVERSAPGAAAAATRKTRGRETTPTQTESKKGRGKSAAVHANELEAIDENLVNDQDGPEQSREQIAQEIAQYASRAMHTNPTGEFILDNLPMTYGTASGILDELNRAPEDLSKAFKVDSNLDTKFKYTSPALGHEVGRILHIGNDSYLDVLYMKQAIFKDIQSTDLAGNLLESISYRINLAILAAQLWSWNVDDVTFASGIAVLDNRFPDQFLSQFYNGSNNLWVSKLIEETLNLALSIRTQAAIAAYKQGELNNPAEIFWGQNEDGAPAIRGFGNMLWADQGESARQRSEQLQEIWRVNEEDVETTAQALSEEYPVSKFVIESLTWVRHRAEELKFAIRSVGGIDEALQIVKENQASILITGGFNAPQVGAQKEVFTQAGFASSLIPTSQLSQDHGFTNHSPQATPTPRKQGKRKATSNQNGSPETKKQRIQRENPIDSNVFHHRLVNMSQTGPDPSQATFQPAPTITPAAPKEPKIQSRVKWTMEEVNALILYIEMLGPQWSKIKDVDNDRYLSRRDQVALKDKARNLKFECLKQGRPMYNNFETVTLSQSMRAKLVNMGHPAPAPTQAEAQPSVEGEQQDLLPGVAEYNNANDDATASQNDENAFEDAPEGPTQEDMPVDPNLSR